MLVVLGKKRKHDCFNWLNNHKDSCSLILMVINVFIVILAENAILLFMFAGSPHHNQVLNKLTDQLC